MIDTNMKASVRIGSGPKQKLSNNDHHHQRSDFLKTHGEAIAAGLSGLLILLAWLSEGNLETFSVILYLTAYVIGGFAKAREGIVSLVSEKKLDVNLLMLLAAAGAAAIGYWAEGALLIFIFALSGALEEYSEGRSRRDLSALLSLKPETARILVNGEEREISIDELSVGDSVLVKPGEQIPADGTVIRGASEVNQATITGESVPVEKNKGMEVFTGTMNGTGSLLIRVDRRAEESTFAKILRLVREAEEQTPPSQGQIDRLEGIYVKAVLVVTGLLLLLPPVLLGWSWGDTVYRAMVFMVVASPCAVVASIMPAVLSAMSNGARKGLLFKGGAYVQTLSEVKVVAFDKTGTLTRGELAVTDLIPLEGIDEGRLLQEAATLESLSEHPLARAIVVEAGRRGITFRQPERFESQTGRGVEAEWDGQLRRLGKPAWLLPEGMWSDQLKRLEAEGKTVVCLADEAGPMGLIALKDTIRPEAKAAVEQLKKLGVTPVMLTGDRQQTAEAIARQAGIEQVRAELLPEEKVKALRELEKACGPTVMVGDGVNDAPALAVATVGIAMGAAGSDVALETARVVLMNDDLNKVAEAIALGKRTWKIVRQNLIFAFGVIALLIITNFIQGIPLPLGVVGHEGSTLLVILNGLRLLR
ncbi:heavy metal translocating P-type ATPase [Kroppenstedtia eburnea]|uniref:Cd2+/Zn2+-exporting ATPase n=1 Tax=Kroppenstedtia eburnea TaxID=714067 RepID=A0A1N7P5S1_9BACL|nr:heavy metal translocating P-type ATPase [Kroppenstedtia eburnea]QKI80829.1 heavy metal translocating P-type ATPase [Kroppenstedtia eburnea]SIT05953.1 Cd2+/Zn2+-exporting ATPase [Kroppenstedtia eburnea]